MLTTSSVAKRTRTGTGGKTIVAEVGVLVEEVEEAAERVVAAAVTVGVAAHTTAVEEAAETEPAVTRQGLGQVVELPDDVRAVVLGDTTGDMVAAVRGAVKMDAGMAQDSSSSFSSSTADSSADQGEVKVVAGKGQVTSSLVDIAPFAKRLSKLTEADDRAQPLSSDLARARTFAIAIAAATAKATLDDSVNRAYVKLPLKDVARISVLPFPASLNKSDGAQRLTCSVKSAMPDIIMRCDSRCTEGLRSPTWVPGWDHPPHKMFTRAITPGKPTTAHMTTVIDVFFVTSVTVHGGGGSWT